MMFGFYSMIRDFFAQSFFIPSPPLTEKNLPDQLGKVFIITGGYAGVGKELTSILYAQNAIIYIAGRSASKAESAIKAIQAAHPDSEGKLHFLSVDLSDLSTIKPAVEDFLSKETKLHWLNNNAGVMVPPAGSKGAQGIELQYQTNILGPFLLTKLLLPILKKTAQTEPKGSVRVSWAGSLAVVVQSPTGGVQFTPQGDLKDFSSGVAYGVSKAANYLLASEFGRRYGGDGVVHNSYNPGNLASELARHTIDSYGAVAAKVISFLVYPPIFGAYTELYAGLSQDGGASGSSGVTGPAQQGAYIVPWGRKWGVRADVAAATKEGGNAGRLLEWCEGVTGGFA